MHVSELHVYPVKSLRGIALERAMLDERGIRHDRRWMVVDEDAVFITQRETPRMALIDVALRDDALVLDAPGMEPLSVPFDAPGPVLGCRVWRDTVDARAVSAAADAWLSAFLERACRLVHMPATSRRIVNPARVKGDRLVGFADGYPLLVIGQRSLDGLNERLAAAGVEPLPMRRFRPNIVVAQCAPHAEDGWRRVRIGSIDVDVVKPCDRCAITTVDPATGQKGVEPLRTLATYRKQGSQVLFGQNAVHRRAGSIAVGDPVTVLEASPVAS
jgi:uncharacterized protein YcbX